MKRISLIALLLLVSSCGKNISEIFSAPSSQESAGLIASCTTKSQAQALSKSKGISFRVINQKRKLVEFYGIDKDELQGLLPKSKIKKNIVYSESFISGESFGAKSYGDYPFYGAHSPQYRNASDARYFPHLVQINGLQLNTAQGQGVTIAVIDTGVYYNHPHLSPNIKVNSADPHGSQENSIDDDGNGFKDDYVGWDFYNGDAYPIDDNGHGTHVAGLAAGTYGGVAPKAKILPIKVLNSQGSGDLGTISAGILYALDMGADIINLSLGGPAASTASSDIQNLISSVSIAKGRDALIIAAAGNGGQDGVGDCNDQAPIYPANIDSSNIISVASVDENNQITNYSNFGKATVDVAAPGGSLSNGGLLSTGIPYCGGPCSSGDQSYVTSSGTSMATPVVSGLAALIKSAAPHLNHKSIKNIIEKHGKSITELKNFIKSGQVINVGQSLSSI